jgi:hypothetical protein
MALPTNPSNTGRYTPPHTDICYIKPDTRKYGLHHNHTPIRKYGAKHGTLLAPAAFSYRGNIGHSPTSNSHTSKNSYAGYITLASSHVILPYTYLALSVVNSLAMAIWHAIAPQCPRSGRTDTIVPHNSSSPPFNAIKEVGGKSSPHMPSAMNPLRPSPHLRAPLEHRIPRLPPPPNPHVHLYRMLDTDEGNSLDSLI